MRKAMGKAMRKAIARNKIIYDIVVDKCYTLQHIAHYLYNL